MSFLDKANNPLGVLLLAFFSILLLVVWIAYFRHADPWIRISKDRAWQIEDELASKSGISVRLHHEIREKTERYEGRGRKITTLLVIIVVVFWLVRIALAFL